MPHPHHHGIDGYFGEFAAHRRRVATVLLVVSTGLGMLTWIGGRRAVTSVLDDPKRFGFEGPTQWVERIRLEELIARHASGRQALTYLKIGRAHV